METSEFEKMMCTEVPQLLATPAVLTIKVT